MPLQHGMRCTGTPEARDDLNRAGRHLHACGLQGQQANGAGVAGEARRPRRGLPAGRHLHRAHAGAVRAKKRQACCGRARRRVCACICSCAAPDGHVRRVPLPPTAFCPVRSSRRWRRRCGASSERGSMRWSWTCGATWAAWSARAWRPHASSSKASPTLRVLHTLQQSVARGCPSHNISATASVLHSLAEPGHQCTCGCGVPIGC